MGYALPTFQGTPSTTSGGGGTCSTVNNIYCGEAPTNGGGGGDGGGGIDAVTVAADGVAVPDTKTAGVLATVRSAEGDYLVTMEAGTGKLIPTATIDYTAGNGGDGISPYKSFSSFEVAVTDNTSNLQFDISPANNIIAAFGPDTDDLWKHNLANFTAAAVQEDANGSPVRTQDNSGCISKPNGTFACFSGANTPFPARVYNIATDTWYDFGTNTNITIVAADDSSALTLFTLESGVVKKYTPTLSGSPTLNLPDWSQSVDVSTSSLNLGTQDFAENNLWFASGMYLYQFNKTTGANVSHKYPTEIHTPGAGGGAGTPGGNQTPQFDPVRRCLYVMLHNVLSTSPEANWAYIYEYRNYSDMAADSGQWFRRITLPSGIGSGMAIGFDPATETFGIALPAIGVIRRYVGYPLMLLDEVPVDDTPANTDIDYDLDSAHGSLVVNENYMVISVSKGGQESLIKVLFNGADIPLTSYGGAIVSRGILIAAHAISDTEIRVLTYLATSPNLLVDAQFHLHIARSTDTAGGGGGGTGTGETPHQHVLAFAFGDATPELIGQIAANKQILEVTIFITQAFNGTGPTLSIGTFAAPTDIMSTTENVPGTLGAYGVYSQKSYGAATDLYLHIVPGSGASAGTGIVVVEYQP